VPPSEHQRQRRARAVGATIVPTLCEIIGAVLIAVECGTMLRDFRRLGGYYLA
jgi:hypothetical protein